MFNFFGGSDNNPTQNNPTQALDDGTNPIIIANWATKGGVGKTTVILNLAYYLYLERGMRVVVVDADPQRSLTTSLCSEAGHPGWKDSVERGDIYKAWKAAHKAAVEGKPIREATLVHPDCAKNPDKPGGLFLLPGTMQISYVGREIAYAQDIGNRDRFNAVLDFTSTEEARGIFRPMLIATAKSVNADVVFVDMDSRIDDLNMNLLMSSDFFTIPAKADNLSWSSLQTTAQALMQLAETQRGLVEFNHAIKYKLKETPPKFAGVVFSAAPMHKGKIININRGWIRECHNVVVNSLMPTLREYHMEAPYLNEIADESNPYTLMVFPQFTKVYPILMQVFAPVFGIDLIDPATLYDFTTDMEQKKLSKKDILGFREKKEQYKKLFAELSDRLFKVIGHTC